MTCVFGAPPMSLPPYELHSAPDVRKITAVTHALMFLNLNQLRRKGVWLPIEAYDASVSDLGVGDTHLNRPLSTGLLGDSRTALM